MGVLCLSVCFSWLIRGGVAPTAGPISSPSLGSVKWKEISGAEKDNLDQIRSVLVLVKAKQQRCVLALDCISPKPDTSNELCRQNLHRTFEFRCNVNKRQCSCESNWFGLVHSVTSTNNHFHSAGYYSCCNHFYLQS